MAKNLLLEIGLEEVPAQYVRSSSQQLKERVSNFLTANRLAFASVTAYATPRRLAVLVTDVAEQQEDLEEEAKGPAQTIAQDQEGNWTKAAQGFVKGQGLETSDIYWKGIKGVSYAHVTKKILGKPAQEILPGLKEVVLSMTFPVTMTWGSHRLRYIRPIHWLIALYGQEVIPFDILGVETGTQSRGHRFLGQAVQVESPETYLASLEKVFVLADQEARKELIAQQIQDLAQANDWVIDMDEDLLEEVASIVEYPTAFYGSFDAKYLAVPDQVLITTMKEHQRYFYVKNKSGQLLPYFVSVRNGNNQHLENVIKGNEKVLVARLEDALFFTNEDAKISIDTAVEKLKKVNFHVKIGSIYEKMERTKAILAFLADSLDLSDQDALRAAEIYKFDLVTNMVGEFPELQGLMGEKYALDQGENPAVAQAIREHYLPLSSEGALPESQAGALLALADKLDTLISFFIAGMVPSGSNDPYALRRQAIGLVSILEKEDWHIHLPELLVLLLKEVYNQNDADLKIQLIDFIEARVAQKLQAYGIRHDIIEAVTHSLSFDVPTMVRDAKELQTKANQADFKETIEALSRVVNLARKAESTPEFAYTAVQKSLFQTESETALWEAANQLEALSYDALAGLTQVITNFFDENMVLVEDVAVRNNRLGILTVLAADILNYADVTKLVVK